MRQSTGNLATNERAASALIAALLGVLAVRGGPVTRVLAATSALALLGRAFAGHCGMKAALTGESTLGDGMLKQWDQMKSQARDMQSRRDDTSQPLGSADASSPLAGSGIAGEAEAPGWMSHHNGRVTGANVPPGAGDAEAGTASLNP